MAKKWESFEIREARRRELLLFYLSTAFGLIIDHLILIIDHT